MKKRKLIFAITLVFLLTSISACKSGKGTYSFESGTLIITFEFERQSDVASRSFNVWIEDSNGNYINALYETDVEANYNTVPSMERRSYSWELTNINGEIVQIGDYNIKVGTEGNLNLEDNILYSGVITIGVPPVPNLAHSFVYETKNKYISLIGNLQGNTKIGLMATDFIPTENN